MQTLNDLRGATERDTRFRSVERETTCGARVMCDAVSEKCVEVAGSSREASGDGDVGRGDMTVVAGRLRRATLCRDVAVGRMGACRGATGVVTGEQCAPRCRDGAATVRGVATGGPGAAVAGRVDG